MKIKTNLRAGGGSTNSGGVNSGGVNAKHSSDPAYVAPPPPPPVVYYPPVGRCVGI